MMEPPPEEECVPQTGGVSMSPIAGLFLLVVRGVLLWLVIPIGSIAWVLTLSLPFRRGVSLSHFLAWIDINLLAVVQKTLLCPLIPQPTVKSIPAASIAKVTHRIGALDLH
jgi:hypothetical protein